MRQTFQQNTNGISFTVLVIFILAILSGDAAGQNLTFPAYFDWHNKNGTDWMTPVKNQGGCASCWAFSAVGVVEAVFNIYNNNPNLDLDLSEQQLVSSNGVCCSYCGNCSGGRSLEALEYIRDTGIVDEACFPYTSANSNCSLCSNWTNRKYHINDYFKVTPNTKEAYKEALMVYGPLSVRNSSGATLHYMVIVGWNDTGNYWIMRNSYGTGWGTNGYGKIPYGVIEQYDEAYAVNSIHQIQCQENDSVWVNCSDITYNDNLTRVRINCSDISGSVVGARFKLENVPDNTIFFDNTTTTNIGGWWVYNDTINIRDSGDWKLTAFCVDSAFGGINGFPVEWSVPWGHLETYLIEPAGDINVTQYEFFNFSSGVKCVGGECGNVSAALDPPSLGIVINEFNTVFPGWVELYNYGPAANMSNWVWYWQEQRGGWIRSGNYTIPNGFVLNSKSFVIIRGGSGTNNDTDLFMGADMMWTGNYSSEWGQAGALIDSSGVGVDYFRAGSSTDNPPPGTLWNLPNISYPIINCVGYRNSDIDTDTGNDWSVGGNPTKGYLNPGQSGTYKGDIPMNNGTPFYTISQNPVYPVNLSCLQNMQDGNSCNQTWQVNATGENLSKWKFFAIYNPLSYPDFVGKSITKEVNVTIIAYNRTAPFDNLYINSNTKFYSSFYNFPDAGAKGVIIINSSNIVLDCSNAVLNGSGSGYGIYNPGFDNVNIKNCDVKNYNYGIYVYNSEYNKLLNNIANSNNYGIYLNFSSSFNDLINNNVTNNNNTGIYFSSNSSNNNLTSNSICGNGLDVNNSGSNSGDDNACDTTYNWNDTGTEGCTIPCCMRTLRYNLYKIPNSTGQNLISLPLVPSVPITTAEKLCTAIPNSKTITRWDPIEQRYKSHTCNLPFTDFPLYPLRGYNLAVDVNTTWTLEGCPITPEPIDLIKVPNSTGLNHIGLLYNSAILPFMAQGLCQNISNSGTVTRWDPIEQKYKSHTCNLPFTDFPLSVGGGYRVSVSANTTWTPR